MSKPGQAMEYVLKKPGRPKKKVCRQVQYARELKAALIEQLGGECELCKATDDLEFDHKDGRSYDVNRLSYAQRLIRYRREAELNLLRLLCGDCNKKERKKNDNGQFIRTEHASLVPLTKDLPF